MEQYSSKQLSNQLSFHPNTIIHWNSVPPNVFQTNCPSIPEPQSSGTLFLPTSLNQLSFHPRITVQWNSRSPIIFQPTDLPSQLQSNGTIYLSSSFKQTALLSQYHNPVGQCISHHLSNQLTFHPNYNPMEQYISHHLSNKLSFHPNTIIHWNSVPPNVFQTNCPSIPEPQSSGTLFLPTSLNQLSFHPRITVQWNSRSPIIFQTN